MRSHARSIEFAYLLHPVAIFILVGDVDDQPSDHPGFTAGLSHDRYYICQRSVELFDQIVAHNLLLLVPTYLAGDEQRARAGIGQDAIRITSWRAERFRIYQA